MKSYVRVAIPADIAYLESVTPETWSEADYLAAVAASIWPDEEPAKQLNNLRWVLQTDRGRSMACKQRLALFCIVYLRSDFILRVGPHTGEFTVNDLTLHAWRTCGEWLKPRMEPKEMR